MKSFRRSLLAVMVTALFVMVGCNNHIHTFSEKWSKNETSHWHESTCEHVLKDSEGSHTWNHEDYQYDSATGKDILTCTVCEYVDKKDHTHIWDNEEYKYDSESGKDIRTCKACAFVDLKEHTHNEDTGTVTTESTYFTKGVKTFKCTDCSDEVRTEDIPELYSYPVDTETGLPATVASKTVYFGVFPNTIKDESVTVDTTDTITVGKNCYYKGSDGEWYEKVTADPYPAYTRKYSNNTVVVKGSIDYFKVEPIKWNVLKTDYDIDGEEGSATGCLLHSAQYLDVGYYYSNDQNRTIGGKTIASNNYQYSTVRAYLNGKYESNDTSSTYKNKGFLQTAFTESAQALILDTLVDNSLASTTDGGDFFVEEKTIQYVCDDTIDKIFLLSVKEVTSMEYGFAAYNIADKNRKPSFTDYVYAKFVANEWNLRSPSESKASIVKVDANGRANYKHISYSRYSGIVPALTISLPLE